MKPEDLIGSIIGTDIGPVKIKQAHFCGMTTDRKRNLTKVVKVVGECGAEFEADMDVLTKAAESFKTLRTALSTSQSEDEK